MKIAVATLYDSNYKELADLAVPNRTAYCEKHGYFYREKTENFGLGYGFAKIQLIQELQRELFDWIYFGDLDVLCMNMNESLDQFIDNDYSCVVSKDVNGINLGSMLVKCSEEGRRIMSLVMDHHGQYKTHSWQEQQVFIDKFSEMNGSCKVIPQKSFNSYIYSLYGYPPQDGEFSLGDCFLHLPGLNHQRRVELVKQYLPQAIC